MPLPALGAGADLGLCPPTVFARNGFSSQDDVRGGREASLYETIFSDEENDAVRKEDMVALRSFVPRYCE
jgi:hypothetical protein